MGVFRLLAVVTVVAVLATGCGGGRRQPTATDRPSAESIDYEALGLWDDGPCDESKAPLRIGFMATLESGVISLASFGGVLEASASAFNQRGGANGACVKVVTCDDKANVDDAVNCVRQLDDAGVVATVNDQGTAGAAEVSAAMAEAGIPRVASNVASADWGDPNAYPTDAGGTGSVFLLPQGLLEEGATKLALVRVDLAQASALTGFLETIYEDDGVSFPIDIPVAAGTTDYTQFILAAQQANADGLRSRSVHRRPSRWPRRLVNWAANSLWRRVPSRPDDEVGRRRGRRRDGLAPAAPDQPRGSGLRGPPCRPRCRGRSGTRAGERRRFRRCDPGSVSTPCSA